VIDTPGYADFVGEIAATLRVVDGAVLLASAVDGLEVGTEQAWSLCQRRQLPRLVVVNRMDRENASFERTVEQLRERFGSGVVAAQLPIGARDSFRGVVDLLTRKAQLFGDGGQVTEGEVPAELAGEVDRLSEQLIEAVAETDEALTLKYLEGESLTPDELRQGLRQGVLNGAVVPVFAAAAAANRARA
jgi:elongation factor G